MVFYKIAYRYLKQCHIAVSESFLKKRMQSHPDYPMMTSLIDTLDELKIPYVAAISDKENISGLSYPLLAHTRSSAGVFEMVRNEQDFMKDDNKLLNIWDGITLMVTPRSKVNNSDHDYWFIKKLHARKRIIAAGVIPIALLLAVVTYYAGAISAAWTALNIWGIFVCSLIFLKTIGKENAIVEQFCSADGKSGCDDVLDSTAATIWKNITWGDLGLCYFVSNIVFTAVSLLMNTVSSFQAFSMLTAVITLPLVLTSVLYQWKVIKHWCTLCIAVAATVTVQAILMYFLNPSILPASFLSLIPSSIAFVASFSIVALMWMLVKPLLEKSDRVDKLDITLKSWRRNPDVFLGLQSKQQQYSTQPILGDLILGNTTSPNRLLVVVNPFCPPCAETHKHLDELFQRNQEKLCIVIRFAIYAWSGDKDLKVLAVANIIQAFERATSEIEKHSVLNYWFSKMNLESFVQYFKTNVVFDDYTQRIKSQSSWTMANNIRKTPTVIFNGRELSAKYHIQDLEELMPLLSENIATYSVVANAE